MFNLVTCLIRNTLAISPLAVGIGAVDRIRPLRREDLSAALANPILLLFQPPLFQIFPITPVPAQVIIAIFLTGNLSVEDPATAFADDLPYSRVWVPSRNFFLIPLFQHFLIFIFPITVPHGIFPSFHRTGRVKNI